MRIKRLIQLFFANIISEPEIPQGKTCGYSLVKSEIANCTISNLSKLYAPYFLHNVQLGDYSYIAKNSNISNTTIGKFCSIGPNVCCGLGKHPTNGISTSPMFYSTKCQNGTTLCTEDKYEECQPIIIGNDVFIGANVTILDGVTIADGAIIGAGAVVTNNIPPYAIAVGVPAKIIKYRFSPEKIKDLLNSKWWNVSETKLRQIFKNNFEVDTFINESSNRHNINL